MGNLSKYEAKMYQEIGYNAFWADVYRKHGNVAKAEELEKRIASLSDDLAEDIIP